MKHTFVVLAYKQSMYLEACLKSVLHQKFKSNVVIATSTPCDFISTLANKYNLEVIVNDSKKKGIGYDFDFGVFCVSGEIVTVVHQDDIYDYEYSYEIVRAYNKNRDALIIFSDYYEIRNNEKVFTNVNLKIKRILLSLVKIQSIAQLSIVKRSCLAFGNAICCPAVSFCKENIKLTQLFTSDLKCNVDWLAWERLSNQKGKFIFVNKKLMGHRVHEDSTTTSIIEGNIRTKEDLFMFQKFWPKIIAQLLTSVFSNSEKSNRLS